MLFSAAEFIEINAAQFPKSAIGTLISRVQRFDDKQQTAVKEEVKLRNKYILGSISVLFGWSGVDRFILGDRWRGFGKLAFCIFVNGVYIALAQVKNAISGGGVLPIWADNPGVLIIFLALDAFSKYLLYLNLGFLVDTILVLKKVKKENLRRIDEVITEQENTAFID